MYTWVGLKGTDHQRGKGEVGLGETSDEIGKLEPQDSGYTLSGMVSLQLQHAQNFEVLLWVTSQLMGSPSSQDKYKKEGQTQRCSVSLY